MDPDFVALAADLAPAFARRAPAHDRDGTFPFENFEDLGRAGFMKLTVPRSVGGYEVPLSTYTRVIEELAAGDGSTALAYMMHAKLFGQQRDGQSFPDRWMGEFARGAVEHGWMCNSVATEEGLGSPAGGGLPDTVALEEDGAWRLNGRKTFTTLAPVLKYFIVLARIDDPAGGVPDLAVFVLYRDDPGVRIDQTWDSLGMRSTGSHDFVMESARIPGDRLVTRRRRGEPEVRSSAGMAWFALGVASTSLGVARAARDYAVAFAKTRTPNSARTIAEYPGVRMRLARVELLLHRSRTLIADAARRWETREETGEGNAGLASQIAIAKIDTLNNCIEAVDLAMRVVGGVSLQKSRPIERYYRDVRAGLHNPPLEDAALEIIARNTLGE